MSVFVFVRTCARVNAHLERPCGVEPECDSEGGGVAEWGVAACACVRACVCLTSCLFTLRLRWHRP